MGRYIEFDDVIKRYRRVDTKGGADEVDPLIVFAENMLDGMLGSHFVVPFSSNNATARDLAIDVTYWYCIRFTDEKKAEKVMNYLKGITDKLRDGKVQMMTDSQEVINASNGGAVYSNTKDFTPIFDVDQTINHGVDSDRIDEIEADRDIFSGDEC